MKSWMRMAVAVAAAAASFSALAANVPLPIYPATANVIPGTDSASYAEQTCGNSNCPTASNSVVLGFNITTFDGTTNLILSGIANPLTEGFYTFNVTVFNGANAVIASGAGGNPTLVIPNFNTSIGSNYHIQIDWLFTAVGTAQTASWSVTANTARAPVKIPEPGTLVLLGAGIVAFGFARRRKQA